MVRRAWETELGVEEGRHGRQIPEQMPALPSFSFCAAGRGAPVTMAGG